MRRNALSCELPLSLDEARSEVVKCLLKIDRADVHVMGDREILVRLRRPFVSGMLLAALPAAAAITVGLWYVRRLALTEPWASFAGLWVFVIAFAALAFLVLVAARLANSRVRFVVVQLSVRSSVIAVTSLGGYNRVVIRALHKGLLELRAPTARPVPAQKERGPVNPANSNP